MPAQDGASTASSTRFEATLATLLSICFYTFLWLVGMVVGAIVTHWPLLVIGLVLFPAGRRLAGATARALLTDLAIISIAVGVIQLAVVYLNFSALQTMGTLIGGIVFGVARRKGIQSYITKRSAKLGSTLILLVGAPVLFIGVIFQHLSLGNLIDISVEDLILRNVAAGWKFEDGNRSVRKTEVRYRKNQSTLRIAADRLPQPAWPRDDAKMLIEAVLELKSPGGVEKIRDELRVINGKSLYIFQFIYGGGESRTVVLGIFWYCPRLGSNLMHESMIRRKRCTFKR